MNQLGVRVVKLVNVLSRLESDTWGLPFEYTKQIYQACVGSVLRRGLGDRVERTTTKKINRIQRSELLRIAMAYITTSTDVLQILTGNPSLDILLNAGVSRKCIYENEPIPRNLPETLK